MEKYSSPKFYHIYPKNQYLNDMNLYQYVNSNPLNTIDPLGLWGKQVHHGDRFWGTVHWARQEHYNDSCANEIGSACNAVDNYMELNENKSPMYFIGDLSYHFDKFYNPSGIIENFKPNRQDHIYVHMEESDRAAKSGNVDKALKELGTALHPLQDLFSHTESHQAHTPFHHAPSIHCFFWGDGLGLIRRDCREARENNPNWKDPHRPDKVDLWRSDYEVAGASTRNYLRELMKYPMIQCKCKLK